MSARVTLPEKRMQVVLYEGAGARPLVPERRRALLSELLEAGYSVTRSATTGRVIPPGAGTLCVVGDFAGRPPSLEDSTGHSQILVHDLASGDVLERLRALSPESPAPWMPWFPVIDYDRCTNCMQCLSFCLFDVYGVDQAGRIEVRHESNCKTMCPACSRVCPEVAILFPKYKKGPINGDVVREADISSESMKVDISALLGGDIYASLRERSSDARKRFSTERDESKALIERKRCLKELRQTLDIPDEVLMSLPSAGEIEERARRAREKMELRRARSQSVKDQRPAPSQEEWGI